MADFPSSPETETLIENLLDACVAYERSEGFEGKYRRQDLEEAKQAVRDALAKSDLAPTPPVQPTEEMLDAARDWSNKKYGRGIGNDAAIGCWQAMLAAAPSLQAENDDPCHGPDDTTCPSCGLGVSHSSTLRCPPMPELKYVREPCHMCGAVTEGEAEMKCRPSTDQTGERYCGCDTFDADGYALGPTLESMAAQESWYKSHHSCSETCSVSSIVHTREGE